MVIATKQDLIDFINEQFPTDHIEIEKQDFSIKIYVYYKVEGTSCDVVTMLSEMGKDLFLKLKDRMVITTVFSIETFASESFTPHEVRIFREFIKDKTVLNEIIKIQTKLSKSNKRGWIMNAITFVILVLSLLKVMGVL